MYFDRFDIASAYYLSLSHCHSGQWSVEYSRLCRMSRYFTPSPSLSVDSLSENGYEIYQTVCDKLLNNLVDRL